VDVNEKIKLLSKVYRKSQSYVLDIAVNSLYDDVIKRDSNLANAIIRSGRQLYDIYKNEQETATQTSKK
jgi:hypothetical protein